MEGEQPKKRGRPKKTETTLAVVEEAPVVEEPVVEEPVWEQPKVRKPRKKANPETAISADVSFTSKKGPVTFKALRAPPPQPKIDRQQPRHYRPYAPIHDMYGHFSIS